jgi:hypothetical protein
MNDAIFLVPDKKFQIDPKSLSDHREIIWVGFSFRVKRVYKNTG